jgi:hypothetical protein
MKEIIPIIFIAGLAVFGLGYVYGWSNGFKKRPKPAYKPKTITVKGEKIDLYEN